MIQEILNQHASSLNKVWAHDRSKTVGASEIGQCARKTFWIKHANDPQYAAQRDPEYVDGWGAKMRGLFGGNVWIVGGPIQFRACAPAPILETLPPGKVTARIVRRLISNVVFSPVASHGARANIIRP